MTNKNFRVAIIGAGLAGTTLLKRLVRSFPGNLGVSYQIHVFENSIEPGPGLAYLNEANTLQLNRTTNRMYAYHEGDFYHWICQTYGENICHKELSGKYLPRRYFGDYLRKVFIDSIAESSIRNSSVELHRARVTDIVSQVDFFHIKLDNNKIFECDYVFIATGNDLQIDRYNLNGNSNFYCSPFPLNQYGSLLQSDSHDVAIIGSRLCAIDVANYLLQSNPKLRISMLSRSGKLPRASIPISEKHKLTEFTIDAVEQLAVINGRVELRDIKQLLQKELDAHCPGITVEQLFQRTESFEEYNNVNGNLHNVLSATNYIASIAWKYLCDKSRIIFVKRYSTKWLHLRIGIPVEVRNKILDAQTGKSMKVLNGLKNIVENDRGFKAIFNDGSEHRYDTVINATGIKRKIDNISPLLTQMLVLKNLCQINPFGGVAVNADNCSAIIDNKSNKRLKIIGQLTCGDFYAVNNVDIINWQVKLAVDDVCKQISICS
jgi:uncharacterized NAD(P)/FAD-binding protein YdhS